MKSISLIILLAFGLTAAGCGQATASRTVSGGAMGAAGGAILGAIGGNAALGAAAGAGQACWADISTTSSKRGTSTTDAGIAAPS